jgi:caffeoyl-CoA O-methyltransferase
MTQPPAAPREAWTPGRMRFQLDPVVEPYVLAHAGGYAPHGAALAAATEALGEPAVMMLAKEQYALFRFLAAHLGWRRVLDLGTFTGLSALAFAEGMGPAGRVLTVDRDPQWLPLARRHWAAAGCAERIEARTGEVLGVLAHLAGDPAARFDAVFVDVDKAHVGVYFEMTLNLLAAGGLIMIDNVLWHGWVQDPSRHDADTAGMRAFNDHVASDARVESVMLPIADGMTMIRRRA